MVLSLMTKFSNAKCIFLLIFSQYFQLLWALSELSSFFKKAVFGSDARMYVPFFLPLMWPQLDRVFGFFFFFSFFVVIFPWLFVVVIEWIQWIKNYWTRRRIIYGCRYPVDGIIIKWKENWPEKYSVKAKLQTNFWWKKNKKINEECTIDLEQSKLRAKERKKEIKTSSSSSSSLCFCCSVNVIRYFKYSLIFRKKFLSNSNGIKRKNKNKMK